ncbi:MAG: FAD-dependent oxidoreductase [Oscillospiraceae bacterium]|nr:FAD-dependent oxidoreductase [Oscillospiraceae bacterium]
MAFKSRYPHAFAPLEIRGVSFRNRIWQAPPGCFFAGDERGFVTEKFVSHFRQYARGGAACCTVGNCTIDINESCDEAGQLQLSDPDCVQQLRLFAEMCGVYGCQGSLELTHNGKDNRYDSVGHAPYSASSFITPAERSFAARAGREPQPTIEMTKEHIRETVAKYARAASFCRQAGMKICMIHGAHGNLIAQFASPYYNRRTDEYGGSLENRARFAIEVLDAVRAAVGEDFVIEYRISAEEHHPEQMHFDETLKFIGLIRDRIDIIHISNGLHDLYGNPEYLRWLLPDFTMPRNLNVDYAAAVKKAYPELTVAVVGAIKDVASAEEIIASGKADIVAMNRALHADYDMPRKYAEGKEWQHTPCLRCRMCFRMASPHTAKLCAVNPMWGRFDQYPEGVLPKAPEKKKVAVIGGGPGGIEAMKWLLQRGHDVTLYEKSSQVGGNVRKGVSAPFKADLLEYLQYMEAFAANCGGRVLLNTEATPEMIRDGDYDAVIAAVGAEPVVPDIPGVGLPHVHWAPDAASGAVPCGERVVIIGANTVGTEVAADLAMRGSQVTVLRRSKENPFMTSSDLIRMAAEHGAKRVSGMRPVEIFPDRVLAENVDTGERIDFPCDTVLLATGLSSRHRDAMRFAGCCPETGFYIIGDAVSPGEIRDAVFQAFEVARSV